MRGGKVMCDEGLIVRYPHESDEDVLKKYLEAGYSEEAVFIRLYLTKEILKFLRGEDCE